MKAALIIIASILSLVGEINPILACLGPGLEYTIFFDNAKVKPKSKVTVKVRLERVQDGKAIGEILQVIEGGQTGIERGKSYPIEYDVSSCGPNHHAGDEGTIFVEVLTSKGRIILYPYTRQFGSGRIDLPNSFNRGRGRSTR